MQCSALEAKSEHTQIYDDCHSPVNELVRTTGFEPAISEVESLVCWPLHYARMDE